MVTIIFNLNIQGLNKSNRYSHWGKTAAKTKKERTLACIKVANEIAVGNLKKSSFYTVTLIRHGKNIIDDDNLPEPCKHIRDGIADALGVNDGDLDKIKFIYIQMKDQRKFLEVRILEEN